MSFWKVFLLLFMFFITLKSAFAIPVTNQANITVTGTTVAIDFPGGNDLSFNVSGANFNLVHSFTAEYSLNDTVDYSRIEGMIHDAVLAINHTEVNFSRFENTVENLMAQKFAAQQAFFHETFFPTVEEESRLNEELAICNSKVSILQDNLDSCQQSSTLLNTTFADSLSGYRSENTALSWGLSLVMEKIYHQKE